MYSLISTSASGLLIFRIFLSILISELPSSKEMRVCVNMDQGGAIVDLRPYAAKLEWPVGISVPSYSAMQDLQTSCYKHSRCCIFPDPCTGQSDWTNKGNPKSLYRKSLITWMRIWPTISKRNIRWWSVRLPPAGRKVRRRIIPVIIHGIRLWTAARGIRVSLWYSWSNPHPCNKTR